MAQEEGLDFKALREKFQQEDPLKLRNKPTIPEKPKLLHSPTSGTQSPLISSINAAVENRMSVVPRVVFRDEKRLSIVRPASLMVPQKAKDGDLPVKPALLDENQRKEADLVKQAFKDKKLNLVLPVTAAESNSTPPSSGKSVTPKKKGIFSFKKTPKPEKEKSETFVMDPVSPIVNVPTPTFTSFTLPAVQKPLLPPVPTSTSSIPIPDIPSETPDQTPSLSEEAEMFISLSEIPPPDTPLAEILVGNTPVPLDIPPPVIPVSSPPPVEVLHPALPGSDPAVPDPEQREPELVRVAALPVPTVSASPVLPRSATPAEPVPPAGGPPAEVVRPAPAPVQDNGPPAGDVEPTTPPKRPLSALSALERAEEKSPGKRASDQRVFNLLEKMKRKSNQTSKSPSPVPPSETDSTPPISPSFPPVDYEHSMAAAHVELETRPHHNGSVSPVQEETPVPQPKKPVRATRSTERTSLDQTVDPSQTISKPAGPEGDTVIPVDQVIPAPVDFCSEDPVLHVPDLLPQIHESKVLPAAEGLEVEPAMHKLLKSPTEDEVVLDAPVPAADGIDAPQVQVEGQVPEVTAEGSSTTLPDATDCPVNQNGLNPSGSVNLGSDDAEKKKNSKKREKDKKRTPKNPYAEPQAAMDQTLKSGRFKSKKNSAEVVEEKEQKKKEKQREKEKEKEKEREKKEQKEREKKENEMKKKFKISGQEEPMYEVRVMVDSKGRKDDLPVNSGDLVSIIRTTSCPKGKWLARDGAKRYGYISVKSVDLDIKDMLELGKKASKGANHTNSSQLDRGALNQDNRSLNHYPAAAESFSDDSEEWTNDEDENLSPTDLTQPTDQQHFHTPPPHEMESLSEVDITLITTGTQNQNMQARNEALEKLATFFRQPKPAETTESSSSNLKSQSLPNKRPASSEKTEPVFSFTQQVECELPDLQILPPPDLYADIVLDEPEYRCSN
ncbi:transcription initiation factor TFIID subunit 3 [Denticeps clupeoides]|uniref:transcription initiation factor TFIID subunit 3 n=1 Tax=Denticeps clupeoides TaxID=299321 RepID=UPI0010A2EED6|nr:transcription initiation factor TFIID subunit 3-like [Denticeps clupeoides]